MSDDLVKQLANVRCEGIEELCWQASACLEELEAKLAKALEGLSQCEAEIDAYIRQEYPGDHPVHAQYRQWGFASNPARITLAALKGQDDE